MAYKITDKIRFIKGVGPMRAKELEGIGIHTVLDLLEYRPLDYIFPGLTKIKDLPTEGNVLISAEIKRIRRIRDNVVSVYVTDGTGEVEARWYGGLWLLNNIFVGTKLTLWGKINRGILHQPKFSTGICKQDEITGGQYGIHSVTIRAALKEVFTDVEIPDYIDGISMAGIFYDFHFPKHKEDYENALKALKHGECFLMQLALELRRKQIKQKTTGKLNCFGVDYLNLTNLFPYKFTKDQDAAVIDIANDLQKTAPMSRLLHGEVGSGKTAVAFFVAMLTALNNKRTLILCPTTLLAIQHYETLKGMGWENCQLEISGCSELKIGYGGTYKDIIIGTTALLSKPLLLKTVSLVIIDEQHKFGVHQRALLQKYGNPHVLLMSATPIPRTLAMTVFGDLDISTIKGLPIKRGTVVTHWVLPGRQERMYELLDKELEKGHQIYIIYPRIESGNEDDVCASLGFWKVAERFPSYSTELLTGKYSNEEKAAVLARFKSGETKILVSTIIAEVGLDNPNANVMVIEGADRFGLSQLHQLRGRICRNTDTSLCFLVAETANETSIARLRVMEQTNDGFEIAEHDLRLRGPGEMFSARQHGLPDLKFVDIIDDYELMVSERELAKEYVDKLDEPENAGLKQMLEIKHKDTLNLSNIA